MPHGISLPTNIPVSPGLPSIGAPLIAWYRADQGVITPAPSTGNLYGISQWSDLSGNGNHLTQPTIANRPTHAYKPFGYNNQQAIHFAGLNSQYLKTPAQFSIPNNCTYILCGNMDGSTSQQYFFNYGNGGTTPGIQNNAAASQFAAVNTSCAINSFTSDTSTPNMLAASWAGSVTATLYDQQSTNTISGNVSTDGGGLTNLYLGQNGTNLAFLNGNIAEFIIYGAALSATQVQQLFIYMGQRYGINAAA